MAGIVVILPEGVTPPPLPEAVVVRACATAAEVVDALVAVDGDVVLCCEVSGGTSALAAAVSAVDGTVIKVELDPWDGEAHSEVDAACAGVIAGFGIAGVSAAVALLGDRS
jgi:3-dehydroquinate dehydratase